MSQAECLQRIWPEDVARPITRVTGWKWFGDPWGRVRFYGHDDRLQAVFVFERPEVEWYHNRHEWIREAIWYTPDGAMYERWHKDGPYWVNPDPARDFYSEWEAFAKR